MLFIVTFYRIGYTVGCSEYLQLVIMMILLFQCIAYLGIVFFTYILATPFFLMVEAPFNGLFKMLLESMKPTIKVADVKIKTKIN